MLRIEKHWVSSEKLQKDISTFVKFCLSISVLVRDGGPTALSALGLERADGIDRIDLLFLSS